MQSDQQSAAFGNRRKVGCEEKTKHEYQKQSVGDSREFDAFTSSTSVPSSIVDVEQTLHASLPASSPSTSEVNFLVKS